MEYIVLANRLLAELVTDVRQHLQDGWTPIGGIADIVSGEFVSEHYMAQAMTRDTVTTAAAQHVEQAEEQHPTPQPRVANPGTGYRVPKAPARAKR